jgi:polyhydroxyalkanoate synthesis repressor PhaR
MRAQRSIKKYPNRRLYDSAISRYITLADIRKLVKQRVDFKIVDAESKRDITTSVLLQAIMELHQGGRPVFSRSVLMRAIRAPRGEGRGR